MVEASVPHLSRPRVASAATWMASFLAFPLSGLVAVTFLGPVDNPATALAGGALVGAAVGAAQAGASWRRLPLVRWTAVSAVGVGAGLALGTAVVGYNSSLGSLVTVGAITGLAVGAAQLTALPRRSLRRRAAWVAASAAIWSAGWAVTTLVGVDVERQYAVFGASGAVVATVLTGLALSAFLRGAAAPAAHPASAQLAEVKR